MSLCPRVANIAFLVNPIAGMGGRLGFKGTDGLAEEARSAGASPVAPIRGALFLHHVLEAVRSSDARPPLWLTCTGAMGRDLLESAGVPEDRVRVVHEATDRSTAADTKAAATAAAAERANLLVFVGGDGTARDIVDAIGSDLPILGIPAGVKMHSGVFAVSPAAGAELLAAFLRGEMRVGDAEILDLDEDAYRAGEWTIRFYGAAKTLVEPNLVQAGKMMVAEVSGDAVIAELAEHFAELFGTEPNTLFLFGPGSTTEAIAKRLGLEKTLLGIDAFLGRRVLGKDLNERGILAHLERHPRAKLVICPIGAQGFILGRGNLQLSPEVLQRIGVKNVLVVATPGKLDATPVLRVDTGDDALDRAFREKEYLFVLIGYRTTKLHPVKS